MTEVLSPEFLALFTSQPNHEACLREFHALIDRARTPHLMAHQQGLEVGAYSMVAYLAESGAFEFLWNATNLTPLGCIELAQSGEHACAIRAPLFMPEYEPAVGERVQVEMTPTRAKVNVTEHIAKLRLAAMTGDTDAQMRMTVFAELVKRCGGSEAQALDRMAVKEMEQRDILVVTHGWREQLIRDREDGLFLTLQHRSEIGPFIDRLHAQGRMSDTTRAQMKRQARGEWVVFQPHLVLSGRAEPGTMTLATAISPEQHVSEQVHAQVIAHAEQRGLVFKDNTAATYPPSTPGAQMLASSVMFDGCLPIMTVRDHKGCIGTTIITAANNDWPQWQFGVRHETEEEALNYHREIATVIALSHNTRPMSAKEIEVFDLSNSKRGEA